MADISSNITCIIEEMDLTKLPKTELLEKCEELGIKKCKSKNKGELIEIINTHIPKKQIEIIIKDKLDDAKDKKNIEQEDELQCLYNDLINNTPNQEFNQIYNVDCITKLKTYNDKIINLTILDPPYYKVVNEKWDHLWKNEIDYLTWFEELVVEVSRVSKNNSALYLFGYWRMLYKQIPILEKYGFQIKFSFLFNKFKPLKLLISVNGLNIIHSLFSLINSSSSKISSTILSVIIGCSIILFNYLYRAIHFFINSIGFG